MFKLPQIQEKMLVKDIFRVLWRWVSAVDQRLGHICQPQFPPPLYPPLPPLASPLPSPFTLPLYPNLLSSPPPLPSPLPSLYLYPKFPNPLPSPFTLPLYSSHCYTLIWSLVTKDCLGNLKIMILTCLIHISFWSTKRTTINNTLRIYSTFWIYHSEANTTLLQVRFFFHKLL